MVVSVSSNSESTSNGFCGVPSAVPFSVPFDPTPGGIEPFPVDEVSTRATPGLAASRYFVTNASHEIGSNGARSLPPNSTFRPTGPTSKRAMPWNSGPVTSIFALMLTEIVISPIQTSIVTPAAIRACTSAS